MKNQVQLITYVDRLAGDFGKLTSLLDTRFAGIFGGAHLLPFFTPIDGADAGFDPVDHTRVDDRLGDWDDVRVLGQDVELVADLIVNHVSALSPQFQDFSEKGDASRYAGMFMTFDRAFPNGANEEELLKIYRPRPGLPFTTMRMKNGQQRLVWTTFTPQQIDIDVESAQGSAYIDAILTRFQDAGVRLIRLDAVGYAIKRAGTSCFMIPETFQYISELTARAHALGMEILVEIHSYYRDQVEIARRVDRVYDFALPPLVLHAIFQHDARALKQWLAIAPRNAVTVLDTHDGIGVIDVGADARDPANRPGLLEPCAIDELVETIHERSQDQSRKATGAAASNLDLYQVNCTFYDALGRRDNEYLLARAIQFFAPGLPQVYYVGLLAGSNDMDLLSRSGVGRDINRHYYAPNEIDLALERPVVRSLLELIRFRNSHVAFSGEFQLIGSADRELIMEWRSGADFARLQVNLEKLEAAILYSTDHGEKKYPVTVPELRAISS
ncbi:MAG TPA: sucrose phosphorylase [Terriglobales bacterium]|nr:sucrose phosphorylase [Terriglobales bacterium]